MKRLFLYLAVVLFSLTSLSCQTTKEKEFVWFVVQPEVEVGKSVDFHIHFEEKPDSVWSSNPGISGLALTDSLDEVLGKIHGSEITGDNGKVIKSFYSFYTYAKPTKIGKIDFPTLSVRFKGKKYKTAPFSISVVEKTKIDQNAVKVVWSTDRTVCQKGDTITLSLYEYSKFSETKRTHSSVKGLSVAGKRNQITLSAEENIDNISGIDNFEKLITKKFEVVDVDWSMLNTRQTTEKMNGESYIKRLILELRLTPTANGVFGVGPSEYDYSIYKSNTEYFNKFVPNDDGSHTVTDNGSTNLKIKSNKLTLKIE